jgi:hypothetical protein
MCQLQWIQHCTCVSAVANTVLHVRWVASDAETCLLQCCVFIELHLMLKSVDDSHVFVSLLTPDAEAWRLRSCVFVNLNMILKRGDCCAAC